jgi:hypothetical protein
MFFLDFLYLVGKCEDKRKKESVRQAISVLVQAVEVCNPLDTQCGCTHYYVEVRVVHTRESRFISNAIEFAR